VVALVAIVQNTVIKVATALIEEDVVDHVLMASLYHWLNLQNTNESQDAKKENILQ
jgi:hypothetical protein